MTAPGPLLIRLDRFVELSVLDDDDAGEVVLEARPPDLPADASAPIFEARLSIEMAIDLIDRLVGRVARLKGMANPDPDSAGPISSTF